MSIYSRARKSIKQLIHSKYMLGGITLASFLEATIIPIPLETVMIPLMQKRKNHIWLIAALCTLGCLCGAIIGYIVGYYLYDVLQYLVLNYVTSVEELQQFEDKVREHGFWFVFSTGVTPIPLQVAMLSAGLVKYSFLMYILAVLSSRLIRYFGLAVLVYYFGDKTESVIRKYKWQSVAFVSTLLVAVIAYKLM